MRISRLANHNQLIKRNEPAPRHFTSSAERADAAMHKEKTFAL